MPGSAADVPKLLEICGRVWDDELSLKIEHDDLAQVAIPNDLDDGLTLLSEPGGRARVDGVVHGERVAFNGYAVVEYNHAAN